MLRRDSMDDLDRWYERAGRALHEEGHKPHDPMVARHLLDELGPRSGDRRRRDRRRVDARRGPRRARPRGRGRRLRRARRCSSPSSPNDEGQPRVPLRPGRARSTLRRRRDAICGTRRSPGSSTRISSSSNDRRTMPTAPSSPTVSAPTSKPATGCRSIAAKSCRSTDRVPTARMETTALDTQHNDEIDALLDTLVATGTERRCATGRGCCAGSTRRATRRTSSSTASIDARVIGHGGSMTVATHGPRSIIGEVTTLIGGRRTAIAGRDRTDHGLRHRTQPTSSVASTSIPPPRRRSCAPHASARIDHASRHCSPTNCRPPTVRWSQRSPTGSPGHRSPAGETLFEHGDPADAAYLVVSGRLGGHRPRHAGRVGRRGRIVTARTDRRRPWRNRRRVRSARGPGAQRDRRRTAATLRWRGCRPTTSRRSPTTTRPWRWVSSAASSTGRAARPRPPPRNGRSRSPSPPTSPTRIAPNSSTTMVSALERCGPTTTSDRPVGRPDAAHGRDRRHATRRVRRDPPRRAPPPGRDRRRPRRPRHRTRTAPAATRRTGSIERSTTRTRSW